MLAGNPIGNTSELNLGAGELKEVLFATNTQITNLRNTVDGIHDKLAGPLGGLPLVGNALKDAVDAGADTFDDVAGAIESRLTAIAGLVTITGEELQTAIFAALGPNPGGLDVLPDSVATAADVPVQLFDVRGAATDAEEVLIDLSFGGTLFSAPLDPSFDIGLPGLGLSVTGTITAQASYAINLKIGANVDDGFFVDLTAADEAKLTLEVAADPIDPPLTFTGRLGFLQLQAVDGTRTDPTNPAEPLKRSALTGSIGLNLTDGGDDRLTFGEVLNVGATFSADARAEVHLHNTLSFNGSDKFPSLVADFDLVWEIGNATAGTGGVASASFGGTPTVGFNNVGIDLGTFFSNFAKPIIEKVQDVLGPLDPVVDVLTTRVPIL